MTTTPPTWSELHARMLVAPATGKIVASVASIDSWWSIPGEWTDALCGFAAVEWLLRLDPEFTEIRILVLSGGTYSIGVYGGERALVDAEGPTLDAALRAAVAAVAGEGK